MTEFNIFNRVLVSAKIKLVGNPSINNFQPESIVNPMNIYSGSFTLKDNFEKIKKLLQFGKKC